MTEPPDIETPESKLPESNPLDSELSESQTSDAEAQRRKSAKRLLGLCEPELDDLSGTRFGDYELLDELGRGSSGVVYQARHAGIHRTVALKLMRGADLATAEEIQRFRSGAARAAELEHPNIVPVFHVGERDGRPFFTMRLLDGGNLKKAFGAFRGSQERAARLVASVARAVQHAHERRIVHRDLKPENILLDEHDEPHVADFGLAKRLDGRASASQSSAIVGTIAYMAPEQALGSGGRSTGVDIWALGAIFYELLTGELPFPAQTAGEMLTRLIGAEPVRPPRELESNVRRDFETICLKCLQKEPSRRYATAGELAHDLDAACGGRPIVARRAPIWNRVADFSRRHPIRFALVGLVAMLALAFGLTAFLGWREHEREERRTLETNAFIASSQAGAVLLQLREYADRTIAASHDPRVRELLRAGTVTDPATPLVAHAKGFTSIFVLTLGGRILAQWPKPAVTVFDRDYNFRDYFRGARALAASGASGAYVARVHRSESRQRTEFAISVPVRDERGIELGVLATTLSAQSAFGEVRMEDSVEKRRLVTALLGPRGPERAKSGEPAPTSELTFVVHPALDDRVEYALRDPSLGALRAAFGDAGPAGQQFALRYRPPLKVKNFRDPLPGFDGEWLAAFAPVGKTGYVVLVESPTQRASLSSLLFPPSAVVVVGAASLLVLLSFAMMSRRSVTTRGYSAASVVIF